MLSHMGNTNYFHIYSIYFQILMTSHNIKLSPVYHDYEIRKRASKGKVTFKHIIIWNVHPVLRFNATLFRIKDKWCEHQNAYRKFQYIVESDQMRTDPIKFSPKFSAIGKMYFIMTCILMSFTLLSMILSRDH